MEELNKLEVDLLKNLTVKYPSFTSHIPHIKVKQREVTKTGMYIHIEYINFSEKLIELNALFSNEEIIEIKNLKNGLGYVIDITDGEIKYIELVTYNETWNGKINDYTIIERDKF